MAALIAVGVGMGAEKLGRKISEKRLERKEHKAAKKRDAIYGHAESSTASTASTVNTKTSRHPQEQERKSEETQIEKDQAYQRRRSMSSERTLLPDDPPPQYEEVVGHDTRRA